MKNLYDNMIFKGDDVGMNGEKSFQTAVLAIIVAMIFTGCGGYDKNVMQVREGTLYINPSVPVGKAFDQFFTDEKWTSFKSTEGERVVEFTGKCSWYNAPAKIKIQFTLYGKREFETNYVAINDVELSLIEGAAIIEKVLEEYRP